MDLDIISFLWDSRQDHRLDQHDESLNRSDERLSETDLRIRSLLEDQRSLRYIVSALATVLIDRGLVSQEQLVALIKTAATTSQNERAHLCKGCERPLRVVNRRCIYCGEPAPGPDANVAGQTPG